MIRQSLYRRLIIPLSPPGTFAKPFASSSSSPSSPSTRPTTDGPLAGVRVLDLGQVVAGNFAGALLGYFGANVIKVESPQGDQLRDLRVLDPAGVSLWWRAHGRNKRSIAVNLHTDPGRDLIRRLAHQSDVILENFRPGVMEKWGLGPSDLPASLIYGRISGYGQTGPYAKKPGYASVCEGVGGFRYLNGYPDRAPVRPNISLGDTLAALHCVLGITMSLYHQQRLSAPSSPSSPTTNAKAPGQVVDAAITESVYNMLEAVMAEEAAAGVDRHPSGSTISGVVPSGTFRTKDDQWVIIGGNGDSVYSRLMETVGRPDMTAAHDDYRSNARRMEKEAEIMDAISGWCGGKTLGEVCDAMETARVPAGPILRASDIASHPQFKARQMMHERVPVPGHDHTVDLPALLPLLSETPGRTRHAGADLGHHTDEVLREELGLTEKELTGLRAAGVIA
jgi:crotonobetainyl-CoA:carnitine CoA-transferase CaiB-like acyl-CoA transferase